MTIRELFDELQSLDLKNPGAWPNWAHISAAVLAAIFILGAGTYTLIEPEYNELGVEQAKEVTLRADFERKQKKVAALDAYKQQLAEMQRNFGDMLKQLPSKSEVANLLNDISQTRIASSLDEELFQPQSEVPKDFYAEIPNKIIVTGDYHQMGSFVSGVAALPRIVVIDEVEIKPINASKPGEAPVKSPLRMTALAKTYRYLDASEIAAKPKPAGAP
jgi:type IV pilus assembly protein PilO